MRFEASPPAPPAIRETGGRGSRISSQELAKGKPAQMAHDGQLTAGYSARG